MLHRHDEEGWWPGSFVFPVVGPPSHHSMMDGSGHGGEIGDCPDCRLTQEIFVKTALSRLAEILKQK